MCPRVCLVTHSRVRSKSNANASSSDEAGFAASQPAYEFVAEATNDGNNPLLHSMCPEVGRENVDGYCRRIFQCLRG